MRNGCGVLFLECYPIGRETAVSDGCCWQSLHFYVSTCHQQYQRWQVSFLFCPGRTICVFLEVVVMLAESSNFFSLNRFSFHRRGMYALQALVVFHCRCRSFDITYTPFFVPCLLCYLAVSFYRFIDLSVYHFIADFELGGFSELWESWWLRQFKMVSR